MPIITKLIAAAFRRHARHRGLHCPLPRRLALTKRLVASLAAAILTWSCGSPPGADPQWDIELPFSQVDVVAVVGDAVFCLGTDAELSYSFAPCRMVIYSSATGAERFHTILDIRSLRGSGSEQPSGNFVVIEGTTAVVLSDSGRLRAFEATSGREIWSREDVATVFGSGDGYIFASEERARLVAFEAKTGSRSEADAVLSWKQRISGSGRAVASGGRVFVATGEAVYALDFPGWRERWVQPFSATRTNLQVAGGCVIATGRNGWQVFDAATGDPLWSFAAYETRRPMPPAVSGDTLFTMRGRASNSEVEEGYLRAYDLRTGQLRTRYAMAPLAEPDAVDAAGGRLYLTASEPHYGMLRRPLVESTSGEELASTVDCRLSALDAATGRPVWTSEPACWGSLTRPSISDDGFVAVAAMSPKRNKPARLMAYRPLFRAN